MSNPLNATVLIVDDDVEFRESVASWLSTHGFDVVVAENGRDALARLRDNPEVVAIVLDVEMPVMNGATFRGEQLSDPTIASIPLILLSGREDISPIAKALGAAASLRKPVSGAQLLEAVRAVR